LNWWKTDPRLSTHARPAIAQSPSQTASAASQQESRHGS
jgi:hypothetical protein